MEVPIEIEIVFDFVETEVDYAAVTAAVVAAVAGFARPRTHYSRIQYIRRTVVEHVFLDFGQLMAVTVAGFVTKVAVAAAVVAAVELPLVD